MPSKLPELQIPNIIEDSEMKSMGSTELTARTSQYTQVDVFKRNRRFQETGTNHDFLESPRKMERLIEDTRLRKQEKKLRFRQLECKYEGLGNEEQEALLASKEAQEFLARMKLNIKPRKRGSRNIMGNGVSFRNYSSAHHEFSNHSPSLSAYNIVQSTPKMTSIDFVKEQSNSAHKPGYDPALASSMRRHDMMMD